MNISAEKPKKQSHDRFISLPHSPTGNPSDLQGFCRVCLLVPIPRKPQHSPRVKEQRKRSKPFVFGSKENAEPPNGVAKSSENMEPLKEQQNPAVPLDPPVEAKLRVSAVTPGHPNFTGVGQGSKARLVSGVRKDWDHQALPMETKQEMLQ